MQGVKIMLRTAAGCIISITCLSFNLRSINLGACHYAKLCLLVFPSLL